MSREPTPAYLHLSREELRERIEKAKSMLSPCKICPRECEVDRLGEQTGACDTGSKAVVSSFNPHFGEEAPLVGSGGSGTIFFANCNLNCIYCQNYDISHLGKGEEVDPHRIALIMGHLKKRGCENINLVSPTHVMPQILEALPEAVDKGLDLPLVYNTGGYDSLKSLQILDGILDIYMPDMKYSLNEVASKFSGVGDYVERNREAVKEMQRQVGSLSIVDGVAVRGLLIRHLVLPEGLSGTDEVTSFIAREISKNTYVNIMNQYRPCYKAGECPSLSRPITREEYENVLSLARESGLTRLDSEINQGILSF